MFCCNSSTFFINVDGTEIIHEHRDAQAVVAGEDAVEQRGLAGTEKAGEDGDRGRVRIRVQFTIDRVQLC